MPAERPIQTDLSIHVTKGETAWAITSGTLLGLGVVFPPAGAAGALAGIVGAARVHGRETDERMKRVTKYISESMRPPQRSLAEEVLGFFGEPEVVRYAGPDPEPRSPNPEE